MARKATIAGGIDDANDARDWDIDPEAAVINNGGEALPTKPEKKKVIRAELDDVVVLAKAGKLSDEDAQRIEELLDEGMRIKNELNTKVPDSKGARLEEIKTELNALQVCAGLDGFRHGRIVFVARQQDGKTTVDSKKRDRYLMEHGVTAALLTAATKHAEKTGDDFWVRELEVLGG